MAKRMSYVGQPPPGAPIHVEEGTRRASHRERSEQADAIAGLALLLVGMKPSELAALPLAPELAHAVVQCQGFTKSARARQLRLLGKLLRQADHEALRIAAAEVVRGKGARAQRETIYEAWRERLLAGGDRVLTELATSHPEADVQRLRQLVRLAQREPTSARGKHASRDLLRLIRDLGETAAARASASETDPSANTDADEDDTEV